MSPRAYFWGSALLGTAGDLVSKWLIFLFCEGQPAQVLIPGVLAVYCRRNQGGVFGMLRGQTRLFILLSLIAIAVIVFMACRREPQRRIVNVALGIVLAGALGNLYDRLRYNEVRDFIDLHLGEWYHWPTFNLADAFICIGALLLVLFMGGKEPAAPQQ